VVEGEHLIAATSRPDNRQQKELHYACVNLEEAKYANDLGDRKYANVCEESSFTIGGACHDSGATPGGARGNSRRSGPVPAPRTLQKAEDESSHFYSNVEKAEYMKCTNLEREELMKENGLFQEIRQTLKDRAVGGAPVPTPRTSKRRRDPEHFYSNLPDASWDREQSPVASDQLQSTSSTGSQGDTFQPVDQSMDSGYHDRFSDIGVNQVALDDLADYQPIEFRPDNLVQYGGASGVNKLESDKTMGNAVVQTECIMKKNDLYESADYAGGDDEGLLPDNEVYQPVDVSAGEVEGIMKENDLYQPLNICQCTENYMKENDIYQDF
jgi:hypothetical protein